MPAWVPWLIAAGLLGLAELHTLTLVLGMLAIAAVPAAGAAALGASPALQVLVFAAVSALFLGLVRPVARRHRTLPSLRTGTAALVGRQATVVRAVDATTGQVRIGGEVWSARAYVDGVAIPVGATVDVVQIDGATAVVLPLDHPL